MKKAPGMTGRLFRGGCLQVGPKTCLEALPIDLKPHLKYVSFRVGHKTSLLRLTTKGHWPLIVTDLRILPIFGPNVKRCGKLAGGLYPLDS